MDLKQVEAAALALSPDERAELAARLLESVHLDGDWKDPAEVERAWVEEAKRRSQLFHSGEMKGIPAAEAIAQARAALHSA
ncbi:MAG TPA: addiction module protein [Longimicrobium sp.]|jgi:hypothetical protein